MQCCEVLEGRRLFSFDTAVFENEMAPGEFVLAVSGDGRVEVSETSPNRFSVVSKSSAIATPPGQPITMVVIVGGDGNDKIAFNGRATNLTVTIDAGKGNDKIMVSDAFKPTYDMWGNPLIDRGGFLVYGSEGNDAIDVLQGYRTFAVGGTGNDLITVRSGSAAVYGEEGHDRLVSYSDSYDAILYFDYTADDEWWVDTSL